MAKSIPATKVIIETQYKGEHSWHYYCSCEHEEEAHRLAEELERDKPGKTWHFRVTLLRN